VRGERPTRAWWIVVLAGALLTSCSSSAEAFPPAPTVVSVSMTEYRYRFMPPSEAGRIVFDVRNNGRLDHELVLIVLPEGVASIDEQLRSKKRRVVPTVAELAPRRPGQRGTFAVDLTPGRYAMVCFVQDPDGSQHATKGMNADFRIGG
jgi:hypothetical protein